MPSPEATARLKAEGRCLWCRAENNRGPGTVYCTECLKRMSKNGKALRKFREEEGLCQRCGKPNETIYLNCAVCCERDRTRDRKGKSQ